MAVEVDEMVPARHIVVCLILLAGCTAPEPPAADAPQGPAAWTIPNPAESCLEHVAVLFIDMADAQRALPAGYTVADAAVLLGLPAPTGSSAAFFNIVQCTGASAAEVAVPIEAPAAGLDLEPMQYNLYQLAYISSNASLVARLQGVGFPATLGDAVGQIQGVGPAATASAAARADQDQYTFEGLLGPVESFPGTARFWHENEAGIIHFEYRFVSEAHKGALTSCTIAAGTPLAELAGRTDCEGAQGAVVAIPDQSWEGTVRFLPGAHVS